MNWWTSDERVETFILNENKRNLNKQSNQVFSPFRYCIFLFCLFCFYWDSDSERFSCETLAPLFENANGIMYKSIREIRRWFPNKIKSQEKNNNNKRILSLSISFFFSLIVVVVAVVVMCQIIARWCWLGGREKRRKVESYIDSCCPTADYSKMWI